MSLLMDALKRAERARASDPGKPDSPADPEETQGGLSLDPIEIEDSGDPAGAGEARSSEPAAGAAEPPAEGTNPDMLSGFDDASLSLEAAPGLAPDPGTGPAPAAAPPAAAPGDAMDQLPLEDTSATLPSIKAAQESVEDYFDGTRSISMSMGAVQTVMGEDTVTGERSAVDTRGRQSARAMFEAKTARRRRTSWAAVLLIPLVVLALLAGGGFFFWDAIVATFVGGSTVATRPAAQPVTPPPESEPAVVASTEASTPSVATTTEIVASTTTVETETTVVQSSMTEPSEGEEAPEPELVVASAAAQADDGLAAAGSQSVPTTGNFSATPTIEEVLDTPEPEEFEVSVTELEIPPDMTITEALADAIESAGLQPQGTMGASGIKITRRSLPAKVNPLLSEGYESFTNGDMAAADRAYRRVLGQQPRNRDAMLGLAAIAMSEDRLQDASDIYARLLGLDPNDTVAQAALISLHDNLDPLASETRIKNLLRDSPDSAHLHFSLGNVFAGQDRWPEAQAAFFDAYRLETNNADYAFNLAVSLDRLIQPSPALDYYRLALELADNGVANFQADAVLRRIQAMTTVVAAP